MEARSLGFVYVLHFDSPLAHAKHYIGSTTDVKRRLIEHASGDGARLTEVIGEKGIGFALAALGVVPLLDLRRTERRAKNWHDASAFCEVCAKGKARRIPGTTPYPLMELTFPLSSKQLMRCE